MTQRHLFVLLIFYNQADNSGYKRFGKKFLYMHFSFSVFDYFKSAEGQQTGGTEGLLNLKAQELSYSHVLEEMEIQKVRNYWIKQ